MMTSTRTTELHHRRVRLTREPAAAAEARSHVRAVIRAWQVPVDLETAVLLASDLVTNAIRYGSGATVTLAISCSRRQLRIDAYDASRSRPAAMDGPAGEIGPGLVLIAALSTEWGSYRTPAGQAVYFTLAFQTDLHIQEKTPTSEGVTWQAPPSGVRTNARVQAVTGLRAP